MPIDHLSGLAGIQHVELRLNVATLQLILQAKNSLVLQRIRILELLTQCVVEGNFWEPTNGGRPRWSKMLSCKHFWCKNLQF